MKLHFKEQPFQVQAVQAILDCFEGQPIRTKEYTLDRTHEILKRSRELSKGIQQGILYEEKLLESIGYWNIHKLNWFSFMCVERRAFLSR
jgi:type III restriction enzyme